MSRREIVKSDLAERGAVDAVRDYVASGAWKPGEAIRQIPLAKELAVSRLQIREALRILEAEQMVEYKKNRGYFVAKFSLDELEKIYKVLKILELESIDDIVNNVEDYDIESLEEMNNLFLKSIGSKDPKYMSKINREFHFRIIDLSLHEAIKSIYRNLWFVSERYRIRHFVNEQNQKTSYREHLVILEAMRERRVASLRDAIVEHRSHAEPRLREEMWQPLDRI
ncbi:GntR family transcriptional regulator [Nesterenkonia muleiensis]|uniref:GntR family transcriptional regulator n=1 Tax=Nesterenkonia muleiensis TaxID=2282648 RepID=UPI0013007365|nr:GntR family transcriptional regulator [Nesterenkonia muleiensis]